MTVQHDPNNHKVGRAEMTRKFTDSFEKEIRNGAE